MHRYTIYLPLPDDPAFRKDLLVGTRCRIVELGDGKGKHPKHKVEGELMHKGEPVEFKDWVTIRSLGAIGPDGEVASEVALERREVPEHIKNAHKTDTDVAWVEDWRNLVEDAGPSALLHSLKGMTAVAMRYVHARMPAFTAEDLGVLHRVNALGAKRTEVWTMRAFKTGELMLSPVTPEMKIRMYTHHASVHVELPKGPCTVPDNRVLALDGRGKTHLSHGNPAQHEAVATGSLFWAVERTSKEADANLTLAMCNIYVPEVKVTIPGLPQHTTRLPKEGGFPGIPVLRNARPLKQHTRLIALDDPVVADTAAKDMQKRKDERAAEEHQMKRARAAAAAEPVRP